MKIKPLEEQIKEWNDEEIIYGEPIEQREANYFDGYTQGIYRAKNIIDMQQKQISQLTNNWNELEKWLEYEIYCNFNGMKTIAYKDCLDNMKEIKEGNKE